MSTPFSMQLICMASKQLEGKHVTFNSYVFGSHVLSHKILRPTSDSCMKELGMIRRSKGSQQELKHLLLLHMLLVILLLILSL